MQVILTLAGNIFHGETAGNNFARSGENRCQIRLTGIGAVMEHRERLAVNRDSQHVRFEFDLRGQACCRGQSEDECGAHGSNISHYQTIEFDKPYRAGETYSEM